jgi:hypothetical protein
LFLDSSHQTTTNNVFWRRNGAVVATVCLVYCFLDIFREIDVRRLKGDQNQAPKIFLEDFPKYPSGFSDFERHLTRAASRTDVFGQRGVSKRVEHAPIR